MVKRCRQQGRTQNFHLGVARVETDPGWNSLPGGIRYRVEIVPRWSSYPVIIKLNVFNLSPSGMVGIMYNFV